MQAAGTNRRARLALTYAKGSGPATLFLKAHAPRHRWVHLRNGNLFSETRLYASGVPLEVDHPLVYRAICDWLDLDFLLVMEDLEARGAEPRDALHPLNVEQVLHGVRSLARLHSRYWNYTRQSQPRLHWVRTWAPTQGWQVGLRKRVPMGLARGADRLPAAIMQHDGEAVVDQWARHVQSLSQGPLTLLHADAHVGNVYTLPGNQMGFLDWIVRRGHWSQDVGYFLVGALSEDDRRRSEHLLIEEYLAALTVPAAERPSFDEAWLRYRAVHIYGLTIWLSTLGTDGWQPHAISLQLAQRFAAACIEHDTLGALTSLGV
jgi:Ser/Thr protein kinase RdoA (MazF antagonist)